MKKKYEKPQIAVENFQLCERIASCNAGNDNRDVLIQGWQALGYFNSGECTLGVNEGDELPETDGVKYCYHTSSDGYTLFSS